MTRGRGPVPGQPSSAPAGEQRHSAEQVLTRHGHRRTPAVVVQCDLLADSFVGVHDADHGTARLIEVLPLPTSGAGLLAAIGGIDENAPRLLAGFSRAFPGTAAGLASFDSGGGPTAALGWLFAAAGLLLDLDEEGVARALAGGDPGVRLDTVVVQGPGPGGPRYVLDGRRVLRSALSYRLAGVPGHVLARSMFESLGAFVADAARRVRRDWPAEVIACGGDLFAANVILREAARRGLAGVRVPVLMPGELPVVDVR